MPLPDGPTLFVIAAAVGLRLGVVGGELTGACLRLGRTALVLNESEQPHAKYRSCFISTLYRSGGCAVLAGRFPSRCNARYQQVNLIGNVLRRL